jgi:hypothetical protein
LKHRIAFCVGLTALGVAAATSAQAQAVYVEPPRGYVALPPPMLQPGLPPNEILTVVRASGLRPLTQPARRGGRYVLLASDNMGGQLRVVVNAHNGRIEHASPAHDPRFAYYPVRPRGLVPVAPPQHGAPPPPSYSAVPQPELKDPPPGASAGRAPAPPAPAGAAQDPRLASAPDATSASTARPERTPMPRPRPPRPAIASSDTAASMPTPPAVAAPPAATAEQPAASPPPAPPAETKLVPVAPLD